MSRVPRQRPAHAEVRSPKRTAARVRARPSDAQVTQHRGNPVGDFGDLGVRGFESFDGRHEPVHTVRVCAGTGAGRLTLQICHQLEEFRFCRRLR